MKYWSEYDFGEWALSFGTELLEAWKRTGNADYLKQSVRFGDEFVEQVPDQPNCVNILHDIAQKLWELGDKAAAEDRFQLAATMFPRDAWTYIFWANRYCRWNEPDPSKQDFARAEEILMDGVRKGKCDSEILLDRLRCVYEEADKAGLSHVLKKTIDTGRVVPVKGARRSGSSSCSR
jgi:hypothetical protein